MRASIEIRTDYNVEIKLSILTGVGASSEQQRKDYKDLYDMLDGINTFIKKEIGNERENNHG